MKKLSISKITGNLSLKIISVVIAFLIWLLVSNTNNPIQTKTFSNVPITIVNQSSVADIGKVVEPEGNGMVTLRVKERQNVLEQLTRSDFYVEADMENINAMNSVPLTVTCSNSSVNWGEIDILPSSLKVDLEDKVEQAFVASVSVSGTAANGFAVGGTEIVQGKNIYIAGPESVMKIINQVVAPVNVGGLNSDVTLTAALKVYDKNGADMQDKLSTLEFKDSNGAVLTDGIVQVDVNMWRVKTDIALEVETIGTPAFGYCVSGISTIPVSISLAGTEDALKALGGKLTLKNKISVTGATENISEELDLTDTLADMEGLKLIADADPNIVVEIQIDKNGDETVSIPLSSVELLNQPAGVNLVFTPADKISIGIHAASEDARELTEEDIKASIDLAPCQEEGNHELKVDVKLPEGYELASDVTIIVNSERQPTETETGG